MNDDIRARTDAIPDRQNTLAHYRHIEKRLHRKNRWGGRLFALAGFLFLAGGLSIGAWGNYSQQQEATAAAKQQRDFVPSLRVATIDAGPGAVSISLPGTTAAFAAANVFARATGYIAKRIVDIGDHVNPREYPRRPQMHFAFPVSPEHPQDTRVDEEREERHGHHDEAFRFTAK